MDQETREVLKLLDRMRRRPIPTGRVRLSKRYLEAVRVVESLPSNRNGADKTWVESALREYAHYFRSVRRAR